MSEMAEQPPESAEPPPESAAPPTEIADVVGGPGWILRGSDLRPAIVDLPAFRAGLAEDPLGPVLERLWSDEPGEALRMLAEHSATLRSRALRADCLRDLGARDEAVEAYDSLVEETAGTPREATIRQHRGKALLAADRIDDAVADFRIAVALRRSSDPSLLASAEQALSFGLRCRERRARG